MTWIALLAAGALTVRVLLNSKDELLTAADNLTGVRPGWLIVGVGLEILAYVFYAAALKHLLRRGGAQVGLLPMTGISVVGQAAGNCLPGGLALTGVIMYRQLRRRAIPDVLTGWVMTVASVLFMVALALVAIVAVQVAGPASPIPGLQAVSLTVVGVVVLAVVLGAAVRGRAPWREWGAAAGKGLSRLPLVSGYLARHEIDVAEDAQALVARLATVRLGTPALLIATVLMMLSWLADAAVLGVAFTALGETAPLRGLLLAYCAGQLATALPITPGGLGVVEGSLTLALVAFGGAEAGTLSAVLLYRLISFWGLLPSGALCWLALRHTPDARGRTVAAKEVQA